MISEEQILTYKDNESVQTVSRYIYNNNDNNNNNNNNKTADHRINLKESEKKDKYLDLARDLKKLWNMKVTIVPIVIGALGTITKGLLKGLGDLEVGGRVETIQTTES